MIEIADLVVARRGAPICSVPRLAIAAGERVTVTGDNGSGKTTLLRALAGLEPRHRGSLHVGAAPRERCYVHQEPYLFRGTVLANVTYGLRARTAPWHRDQRRRDERSATAMLARLGLAGFEARRVGGLSGGERRRVALARAFVLEPRLLLLDEPFSDLDPGAIELVRAALEGLTQATVVSTSPSALAWGRGVRLERVAARRA